MVILNLRCLLTLKINGKSLKKLIILIKINNDTIRWEIPGVFRLDILNEISFLKNIKIAFNLYE